MKKNIILFILNGFNQKTEIKYRPLSKYSDNPDFYVKGVSDIDDVIKIQGPLYVVSSITQPSGNSQTNTSNYSYEGLKVHTKGKGILGFEKITVENDITGMKNVTYNTLDNTHYVINNQSSEAFVNGNLISTNTVNYDVTPHADNQKCIFNHPVTITNTNELTHVTVTKNNFSYDDYGNILSMKENYGEDATVNITNTYTNKGSWCDSRLTSSTIITKYKEEPSETKTSNYSYDDKGNILTSSASDITVTINEGDYDKFGNILQKTTSSPGTENKTEKFTYDATGRFVETTTNVLEQTATYSYNNLGRLVSETGIDGLTTSYTYDGWGKLKTVTYPNGKKSTYSTDWLNTADHLFYSLDQTEGVPDLKTFYDYLGRKVRTKTKGFEGDMYTDILYNAKGQVKQTNSPYYESGDYNPANVTTYTYYDDGRTKTITSNGLTKSIEYGSTKHKVTETYPSGKIKVSTYDALGNIVNIVNNNISIDYNYFSNGQLKNVIALGSSISMTYDDNNFRETLSDPNAGNYSFDYDAYGQLESKTTPLGTYDPEYDKAGRITTETGYGNISYTYIESGNGLNQIDVISDEHGEFMDLDYDKYGQVTKMTERVGDLSLEVDYEYDTYGNTTAINYPGSFGIMYIYDEITGVLKEIRTNDNQLIWKQENVNSHDLINRYEYGNGLETVVTYNERDIITNISTGSGLIQNLSYTFDLNKGRFNNRTGLMTGIEEDFEYDDDNMNFNQLKGVSSSKKELNLTVEYSSTVPGQIHSKSDVGTYQYTQENNAGPHAISGITDVHTNYTPTDQNITYTTFGKVAVINQGDYRIEFLYGPDQARKTMEVYESGSLKRKVYYFDNYEMHVEGSNVTELYYIYAPTGLTAIYKKDNSATEGTMYYVHTDHLGSIHAITDDTETPTVVSKYYYNPWGEKRFVNKDNGNEFETTNDLPWLHRGFTGHEHITEIGLINMNGRVYDPDLGMFISPDPRLQAPDNPVNFNRYAYVLNNPLVYTDPDGEEFVTIAAIVIGAYLGGTTMNDGNLDLTEWDYNSFDTYGGIVVGGLAGYAGAAVGLSAGSAALAGGASGLEAGIAGGMIGGAISGGINGAGMTALNGGDLYDVAGGMAQGTVTGGLAGAASGGVGAWIGDFSGVAGSGFKNAIYELGHSTLKGGAQGLAVGGMMATMNQDASYLWKGAAFGAAIGSGMAGLRIATMGPAFVPDPEIYCKFEDFGQVYRRGSIFTPRGAGVTLGRNVVTKLTENTDYNRYLLHHETGHLSQINNMGALKFYSRTASEYSKHYNRWFGIASVYQKVGTLEYGANYYAYDKLGYYYNIWGKIQYTWP